MNNILTTDDLTFVLNILHQKTFSEVSEIFLVIPFSAMDFTAGGQKDTIMNFEEYFSVINMYGRLGQGLFTIDNVIITYFSIVLDIVLGEGSFKITSKFLAFH